MPQQAGYGRGLAAIFPGAGTGPSGRYDTESARAGGGPTVSEPADELLATIATTDSGIALIYRSLDALVEQFQLEDAAVVLEERQIGRQVFCAGRRSLGAEDDELLVAPPGLYTQPALEHDDVGLRRQPAQPGRGGHAAGDAAYDDDLHQVSLRVDGRRISLCAGFPNGIGRAPRRRCPRSR